jgi:hypothetical protein
VQGELGVGEHVVALVMAVRSKGGKEVKEFGRVEGGVDLAFSYIADDELCEGSGSARKAVTKGEGRRKRTTHSSIGNGELIAQLPTGFVRNTHRLAQMRYNVVCFFC